MKPLYALVVQHRQLQELDPEEIDEETLKNTLEALEGDITVKAMSVAAHIRNTECFAEAVSDAAEKMAARAQKLQAHAKKVKEYLLQQMEALGVKELAAPEFTIKVKKNPKSVVIEDESKVPPKYKYIFTPEPEVKIDKTAIKSDIDKGDEVPGASIHQGKRLEIKE